MALPVYANGQILNASDCNLWFMPIAAYKTATTVRNTLTKSIDPDLQITLAASSVYQVQAGIIYTSANAMDFTWVVPASATGGYVAVANEAGGVNWTSGLTWGATETVGALGGRVNGIVVHGMIQTAGSGGTFGFSWASATGPVNCTLGVGSVLTVNRVG
jgi:hypothetical protein